MKFPILALVGAGIGYFLSDKKDSMRNAAIGAGAGFALGYFSTPVGAQGGAMQTVPANGDEQLPENEGATQENVQDIPTSDQESNAVLVGNDYFPIGSSLILASPYRTYTNRVINQIRKFQNGNWLTQPMGDEYFTSIRKVLERGIDVASVVDASNKRLWSKEMAQSSPLVGYST